nr:glycosyl hydrolase [Mucilaginibacter sp. L294]
MKFKNISALLTVVVFAASCSVEKPKSSYTVHPADSLATTATANLYQNMADVTKNGIMFGQQDAVLYGLGWKNDDNRSDVKSVCGDQPAVYGWEIGRIEHGAAYSIDSVNFDLMRKRIIEAYKRGGINTISWHADNPVSNGDAWDVSQKGVVASVLPGGEKHELFMTWLDKVAGFLNSLESGGSKIPVLFRPFHEHTGSWFWWGENLCTPDEYKAMVRMTVDHFRQKGLHNLLYIYSPDQTDQPSRYFERYPGDKYMDMLGVDYYQQQGAAGAPQYMQTMNSILAMLTTEAKNRNKLLVFSETGLEGLPMNNWWTDVLLKTIKPYPVTYVMVWRNAYDKPGHFFGPYPGHPSANNFIYFFKDGKTLFQGDISKMYQ